MNCPKCNRPMPIGAAICSECGTDVGEANAFLGLTSKTLVVIRKKLSSPLFLVYTILTTLLAVFSLVDGITLLTRDIVTAGFDIIVAVGAGFSTYAAWKLYISRDDKILAKDIKMLGAYSIAMMIVTTIGTVFVGMVALIVGVVCIIGGLLVGLLGNAEDIIKTAVETLELSEQISTDELMTVLKNAGIIIAIAGAVLAFVVIFTSVNVVLLYKSERKYTNRLSEAYESGKYDIKKYPKIRPWIFGVFFVFASISSFALSPTTGLVYLSMGAYLAVSSLWFKSIHNGGCDNSYIPTTSEITTNVTYIEKNNEAKPAELENVTASEETPTEQAPVEETEKAEEVTEAEPEAPTVETEETLVEEEAPAEEAPAEEAPVEAEAPAEEPEATTEEKTE